MSSKPRPAAQRKRSSPPPPANDPVFALTHLLGLDFEPRIPRLSDRRDRRLRARRRYGRLAPLFGQRLDRDLIAAHWDEIGRVVEALRNRTVVPSLIRRCAVGLPAAELPRRGPARGRARRAHAVHPALVQGARASPARHRRAQQGRGPQQPRARHSPPPARPLPRARPREPADPRRRAQPRHRGHHPVQLPLPRARHRRAAPPRRQDRRRPRRATLATGMGPHQPHRRLRLVRRDHAGRRRLHAAGARQPKLTRSPYRESMSQ